MPGCRIRDHGVDERTQPIAVIHPAIERSVELGGHRLCGSDLPGGQPVETEGKVLAVKQFCRVQVGARGQHLPGDQMCGLCEVVEISRATGHRGEDERVSCASAGAADPLEVVGRGAGKGRERDGAQIADVDAQLKRWVCKQECSGRRASGLDLKRASTSSRSSRSSSPVCSWLTMRRMRWLWYIVR